MGHRIAIMNEGVLQQIGPPQDVYEKPANLFVARFIGNPPMNTVDRAGRAATATGSRSRSPSSRVAAARRRTRRRSRTPGSPSVVIGVRPEHLRLATPTGCCPRRSPSSSRSATSAT